MFARKKQSRFPFEFLIKLCTVIVQGIAYLNLYSLLIVYEYSARKLLWSVIHYWDCVHNVLDTGFDLEVVQYSSPLLIKACSTSICLEQPHWYNVVDPLRRVLSICKKETIKIPI